MSYTLPFLSPSFTALMNPRAAPAKDSGTTKERGFAGPAEQPLESAAQECGAVGPTAPPLENAAQRAAPHSLAGLHALSAPMIAALLVLFSLIGPLHAQGTQKISLLAIAVNFAKLPA